MSLHTLSTRLAALALAACAWTSPAQAADEQQQVLNFYNWSSYIAPDTVANFEKETGIKVRYDTFDSSELLHAKLVAGRTGYDIVMSSSGWAKMQADGGLLMPLDKAQITNLKNLDPLIESQLARLDPGNTYAVPWLWGYTTVGINVDKVKAALGDLPMPDNAWDLIFKPEYMSRLKSCGVSFLDSSSEVVPAALHYLGRSLESSNPADYKDVGEVLKKVRPYVTLFSSSGYIDDLARGSLCVSMGWSGDLSSAKRRADAAAAGNRIEALMPKSGGVMFFDTMVVPADAPHAANAWRFINYILRPEVHAGLTNHLHYANPNKEARRFVTPELAHSPIVFPPEADMKRMSVQGLVTNDMRRLMARTYTSFKTGY